MRLIAGLVAAGSLATSAGAQSRFIVPDRVGDSLFIMDDLDGNGLISDPAEISLAFNASNAAGTLSIMTPTSIATRVDGLIALGDVVNRNVYLFRDWNRDGDLQDIGESRVVADVTNLSGVSFASPTGMAFDAAGRLYVVNAGNANGADGIYRLTDLTGDGDFQDVGEVTVFIGAAFFGPGNGAYGPQEMVFTGSKPLAGYFRNSTAGLHGIYRFEDTDQNGNCDSASEVWLFWGAGNASGIPAATGLPLEPDAVRPGAVYTLQVQTGGVDQLIRARDLNGDGDAQDTDESVIAYSTAESDFTPGGIVSLSNGKVLLTENADIRVVVLSDNDNDGLFISTGERTEYFTNLTLTINDLRQIAPIGRVCRANCDDSTATPLLTANDFQCFLNAFAAGSFYANCDSSTGNPLFTANDFQCFLNAFAAGCP